VYSRLPDCSILDIPLLIIEKFEGTPILTPGDLTYKELQNAEMGRPGNRSPLLRSSLRAGCILARSLARLPNPLAPTGSISVALSLFIDQSDWAGDYRFKDADAPHGGKQNPEIQRKRAAR